MALSKIYLLQKAKATKTTLHSTLSKEQKLMPVHEGATAITTMNALFYVIAVFATHKNFTNKCQPLNKSSRKKRDIQDRCLHFS